MTTIKQPSKETTSLKKFASISKIQPGPGLSSNSSFFRKLSIDDVLVLTGIGLKESPVNTESKKKTESSMRYCLSAKSKENALPLSQAPNKNASQNIKKVKNPFLNKKQALGSQPIPKLSEINKLGESYSSISFCKEFVYDSEKEKENYRELYQLEMKKNEQLTNDIILLKQKLENLAKRLDNVFSAE